MRYGSSRRYRSRQRGRRSRPTRKHRSLLSRALQQPRMHRRIARDDASVVDGTRFSFEIRDHAARLSHEQYAGRDVPGRQLELPKSLEPPAGDVGEIERRSTRPPDAGALAHDAWQHREVAVDRLAAFEREPGADERAERVGDRRYSD